MKPALVMFNSNLASRDYKNLGKSALTQGHFVKVSRSNMHTFRHNVRIRGHKTYLCICSSILYLEIYFKLQNYLYSHTTTRLMVHALPIIHIWKCYTRTVVTSLFNHQIHHSAAGTSCWMVSQLSKYRFIFYAIPIKAMMGIFMNINCRLQSIKQL